MPVVATATPFPFLSYALQGFVDGLRQQLGVIRIEAFRPVAAESSESA